eukprot:883409-Alexandrium_andersonii.AAC.1
MGVMQGAFALASLSIGDLRVVRVAMVEEGGDGGHDMGAACHLTFGAAGGISGGRCGGGDDAERGGDGPGHSGELE